MELESVERRDIAERFLLADVHQRIGFTAQSADLLGDGGRHEFSFVNAWTGKAFNPHSSVTILPSSAPVPDQTHRRRVHGSVDVRDYQRVGATVFAELDRVARSYFGRSFFEAEAILDWGCGCGRVTQFLAAESRARMTGIDIDPESIAWCRAAFPEAKFEVVALEPPTSLPAEAFDFVISISVLTHLTDVVHFAWLAELYRVTKPGAILLLSINGEGMWVNGALPLDRLAEFRSRGFIVTGKNHDLDGAPVDGSEYFNAFISRRYVFDNWSRYFTVVDVLPGAVSQQDLVILRRL